MRVCDTTLEEPLPDVECDQRDAADHKHDDDFGLVPRILTSPRQAKDDQDPAGDEQERPQIVDALNLLKQASAKWRGCRVWMLPEEHEGGDHPESAGREVDGEAPSPVGLCQGTADHWPYGVAHAVEQRQNGGLRVVVLEIAGIVKDDPG